MAFDAEPYFDFVRWVSGSRRLLVLAVLLVGALAALWYRTDIMAGNPWTLIVVCAWGVVGGLALYGAWMWRLSRPSQRFRALLPETERLLAEFEECSHGDPDRVRFKHAVSGMTGLCGDLVPLGVIPKVIEEPISVASAERNARTLRSLAYLMRIADLPEARRMF